MQSSDQRFFWCDRCSHWSDGSTSLRNKPLFQTFRLTTGRPPWSWSSLPCWLRSKSDWTHQRAPCWKPSSTWTHLSWRSALDRLSTASLSHAPNCRVSDGILKVTRFSSRHHLARRMLECTCRDIGCLSLSRSLLSRQQSEWSLHRRLGPTVWSFLETPPRWSHYSLLYSWR